MTNILNNHKLWLFLALSIFLTNRVEVVAIFLVAFLVMANKKTIVFPYASYSVGYSIEKSMQQIMMITVFIFCYFQIFNLSADKKPYLHLLFSAYLKVSLFMSAVAVGQVAIYYLFQIDIIDYININALFVETQETVNITEHLIRARAFAPESGHLGTLLLPALLYTFFFGDPMGIFNLHKKIILLMGSMLTFSPLVYIALTITGVNFLSRRFRHFRVPMLTIGIGLLAYIFITANEKTTFAGESSGIEGIQMRLIDTYKVFETFSDPRTILEKNASTAVLQSQLYSAWNAPSRWIGTGLGTNSQSFQNAFHSFFSLGIRIFSEMGIIGLFLYLWFVIRHFNGHNYLNICALSVIIAYFFRGGSYFSNGVIFFQFLYYYSSKFNLSSSQ